MKKRLQNILAHAGVASRRRAAELIETGQVEVDGLSVTEKGLKLDPADHKIVVEGHTVPKEEKKYYFLFNKPEEVISTSRDTHGRKKVVDFFKGVNARLYPIGRLDKNTTGLLLVTNDGELTNKLAHPRFEIEKEYMVTVKGPLTRNDMRQLEGGVEIEGKRTYPCKMRLLKRLENSVLVFSMRLHEGRKRQIKLMFEAVGGRVVELKRTMYAGLTLGRLKEGEYRELTEREVCLLKEGKIEGKSKKVKGKRKMGKVKRKMVRGRRKR